jgi:hypothetical protein
MVTVSLICATWGKGSVKLCLPAKKSILVQASKILPLVFPHLCSKPHPSVGAVLEIPVKKSEGTKCESVKWLVGVGLKVLENLMHILRNKQKCLVSRCVANFVHSN